MAILRVALLLAVFCLSVGQAKQDAPDNNEQETVYDIRDLVEKPSLRAIGSADFKDGADFQTVAPARKAALVVEALLSAIESDAGKAAATERESIQVLNGSRLVVRTSAARHAQIAEVLRSFRRLGDLAVSIKAELHEVDDAFHTRLKKVKRADLDELERQIIQLPGRGNEFFTILEKQKPILAGEEIKLDDGQKGTLLSRQHAIHCQPGPAQVRKGDRARQTVWEGVSFVAGIRVSPDRRSVRIKLTEKGSELQQVLKVKARDARDKETEAEVPYLLESAHSQVLDIPDGGSILVPVQYRPRSVQEKGRWWAMRITPRIVIEDEERISREGFLGPILREVAADILNNPRLKTMRDIYGTAGDKRFALVNSAAWSWPKESRPEVPGFQLTAANRAGKRMLGIRVESVQDARNGEAPTIGVTLVNAGGNENGPAIGVCTIRYTARQKDKTCVVELAE